MTIQSEPAGNALKPPPVEAARGLRSRPISQAGLLSQHDSAIEDTIT
jgi:hypothetical protein